jgi:hypothetical protein
MYWDGGILLVGESQEDLRTGLKLGISHISPFGSFVVEGLRAQDRQCVHRLVGPHSKNQAIWTMGFGELESALIVVNTLIQEYCYEYRRASQGEHTPAEA